MATGNGAVDDLEMLQEDIPISALENVDLSLPPEYEDEVFAAQLLSTITQYHSCEAERRSLRHQGEHTKAENVGKQAAVYRSLAALIQYEHPNTKAIYKDLAKLKVTETQKARAGR